MSGEKAEFEFPSDVTRRERWVFENYAGCTWERFVKIVGDKELQDQLTTNMEAALLLIAVRRTRGQTVTFDQVLDSEWSLLPPEAAVEADAEGVEVESPFVPPPPNVTLPDPVN